MNTRINNKTMRDPSPLRWSMVFETLTRPYPVSIPMILLVLLIPFYIVIGELITPGRTLYVPELALDRIVPLRPTWAIIYGSLYMFLIVLPVLIVRQAEQIRRTVWACLMVWITAYICFLLFPTMAPRPINVFGQGFVIWSLRALYSADPPYNCFPSLHVAHSFVSALTCHRLHRGLGIVAVICALLIGLSTLYIKQHYILDVIAGILLAFVAYVLFLRNYPRDQIPELDRRLAPLLAVATIAIIGLMLACLWIAYRISGES